MPDVRLTIKLRALQGQRDQLRKQLAQVEEQIAEIEAIIAKASDEALEEQVARLAADVEEYLGARVVGRSGTRVNLRRRDERGDLLCLVLASHLEKDGTWWTEVEKLRSYLASVQGEMVKQGRL